MLAMLQRASKGAAWSSQWSAVLSLCLLLWTAQAQSTADDDCVDTINYIARRESLVTDTSFQRTYVLCPGTDFEVGTLDYDANVEDGQPMLPLRANMKIQCGADGSRSNECNIRGGDVQVDGTDHFGLGKRPLNDIRLEGITFYNSTKYPAWMNMPGNVHFHDCEFRVGHFSRYCTLSTGCFSHDSFFH
jgi:hypothetical protein